MKFSIIIPVFNGMPYLSEALHSVLKATLSIDHEIIYQDAGSTDGSIELAQSLLPPESIHVEKDNGHYDAINKGFHRATGDILYWLNADDVVKPDAFSRVQKIFNDHPSIQWLVGGFEMIDSEGRPTRKIHQWYKHLLLRHYRNEMLFFENPIPQMSVFMRKEFFLKAGDLTNYYLAFDYEYWLRLAQLQTPWVTTEILSQFRWQPDSKSARHHTRLFEEQLEISRLYTQNPFFLFLHHLTCQRNRFLYHWLP